MLRFKVDDNLPREIVDVLRQAGQDAVHVLDQELGGQPDPRIASVCTTEARALVTFDLDFADVRAYPPDRFPGIVVLRLVRQDTDHVIAVFHRVVALLDREPLAGHLWIVEEAGIRTRSGVV